MSGLFPVAAGYDEWYRAWAFGVLNGLVGTLLTLYVQLFGVLVYALLAAGLVLRAREKAAIGGGLLLTTASASRTCISR